MSGLANTGEKVRVERDRLFRTNRQRRAARAIDSGENGGIERKPTWISGKSDYESTSITAAQSQRAATEAPLTAAARPLKLSEIADESTTSPSGKVTGYRFAEISPTDPTVRNFDLGLNFKAKDLLGGKPNLTPRNPSTDSSMSLSALYMPATKLPKNGLTIAIDERTPDSLTALSILANRADKRIVLQPIVKLVSESGANPADDKAMNTFKAISHIAEAPGLKLGERIRFVRSVLDGTAPNKVLEERALKWDELVKSKELPPPPAVETSSGFQTGIKEFRSQLTLNYGQPNSSGFRSFDIALGVSSRELTDGMRTIDQSGNVGIIERVLGLRASELPKPGAQVMMTEVDLHRLTAAALLEARVDGLATRTPLLQYIQRNGAALDRVPADKREGVRAAFEAAEGFANSPFLPLGRKVGAMKSILTEEFNVSRFAGLRREYQLFRPSEQPFKYIRTTEFKPKSYDVGVEITNPDLQIPGKPNIDHHGLGATANTPSAAEQAIALKDSQLPERDARVAIQKPDADALTAVAVMANRVDKLPVNQRLVEAVGRHDRGIEVDAEGKPFKDVETLLSALRSVARNPNVLINQRISAIRSLLAGTIPESSLHSRVASYKANRWMAEVHAEKTSRIDDIVPGKLAFVQTPNENWFTARQLGLERAPVAVIAAQNGAKTHFEVVARSGHPAGEHLGKALAELTKLENWGGRAEIFVSPSVSESQRRASAFDSAQIRRRQSLIARPDVSLQLTLRTAQKIKRFKRLFVQLSTVKHRVAIKRSGALNSDRSWFQLFFINFAGASFRKRFRCRLEIPFHRTQLSAQIIFAVLFQLGDQIMARSFAFFAASFQLLAQLFVINDDNGTARSVRAGDALDPRSLLL